MFKKILLPILVMTFLLLTSTKTFAALGEEIPEGADLTTIKRIAVAYPRHYKVEKVSDEPTTEALIEMLGTASKSTRFYVVPYDEIVESIKKDTGTDITTLDYKEAKKIFEENIANYADSYIVLTTANGPDPTTFMFNVQNAQTGKIIYSLNIKSRSFGKNTRGYNSACELFYKTLDVAIGRAGKK